MDFSLVIPNKSAIFANVNNKRLIDMKDIVKVKIKTEVGKELLSEIKGLKEGMRLKGKLHSNGVFDFKWNGLDAMLIVSENCEPLYYVRQVLCLIPKGKVGQEYFNTHSELKAYMKANNLRIKDYNLVYGLKLFTTSIFGNERLITQRFGTDKSEVRKEMQEIIKKYYIISATKN